ncbi:hypothetical protein [Streptomyces lavendulae]|uniref:hypothetical protein n=1 Tax=Streptomyces lavendulae TaxID=1914 RepID=UPI0036BF2113
MITSEPVGEWFWEPVPTARPAEGGASARRRRWTDCWVRRRAAASLDALEELSGRS